MAERMAWVERMARRIVCVALPFSLLSAGCRTLSPHDAPSTQTIVSPQDQIIEPDLSVLPRARALALYSHALSLELQQKHDEALEAYRQALVYDDQQPDLYRRIAVNLIRRNEVNAAVAVLEELIAKQPGHAGAHTWLATAHRRARNREMAEFHFQRAIALAPHEPAGYMQLVDLHLQNNDAEKAIALLEEGVRHVRTNTDLHRVLAELYVRRISATPGINAENQQRMDRAVAVLEDALTIHPRDPQVLSSLADLYIRIRRVKDAIPLFERIVTITPDEITVLEKLAVAHEATGDFKNAALTLEKMAALQPTNPRIFQALGGLYERLDDTSRAVLNYTLSTQLSPPDETPFLRLALLQMENEPEEAIASINEGLVVFENSPRLLEMRGYVQYSQQEYAAAANTFDEAIMQWRALDTDIQMTLNLVLHHALSLAFSDSTERAAEAVTEAIEAHPNALQALMHTAFRTRDDDLILDVLNVLQRVFERQPDNLSILMHIGYIHSFQKEFAEALKALDQAYTRATGHEGAEKYLDGSFYFWYAAANEREGNIERAEQLFYKNLELQPDHAETLNYLAYMWAEKGIHLERALEYVTKALEQIPESAAFIDTLGWIFYQQGRYEEAYREIRRAVELIPDDPTILDHLGDIYLKLDDKNAAIMNWKAAYRVDPENKEIRQKLEEHGVELETESITSM